MSFSRFDHECMALALRLAEKGAFTTHPNPRVGCVIARDDRVVGQGWHVFAGGPHAEVVALQAAGREARGSTAYVTLEPCGHHGRTPPCVDALLAAGIARVVIAAPDPHPLVDGSGSRRLELAGVKVESGLMALAAEDLNPGFLQRVRTGRPWVRVKVATSLDGRTALRNGRSQWITCEASRRDVQRWRARASAIVTGIGTVLADDPALTARVSDPPLLPLRVVVDTHWRTPATSRVLQHPGSALIAGSERAPVAPALQESGVRCLPLPLAGQRVDLLALMQALAALELNELQVEAGATLCGALLRDGLVDEILMYQAPALLGEGGPGPFELGMLESMNDRTQLEVVESCQVGTDVRLRLRPRRRNDGTQAGGQ